MSPEATSLPMLRSITSSVGMSWLQASAVPINRLRSHPLLPHPAAEIITQASGNSHRASATTSPYRRRSWTCASPPPASQHTVGSLIHVDRGRPPLPPPSSAWDAPDVFVVHGTQRLLAHVGGATAGSTPATSTTQLGAWYSTLARWRPEVALFVNESTLLPVFIPAAPAKSLMARFPETLAEVLSAHRLPQEWITHERAEMAEWAAAKTASRSVIGVMNEYLFLADHHRAVEAGLDLLSLSLDLARTPMSPLYKRHVSPDRELAALAGT